MPCPKSRWSVAVFLVGALAAFTLVFEVARGAPRGRGRGGKPLVRQLGGPIEPWDLSGEPRPFDDLCFQNRTSLGGLSEKEARRWLEATKDHPLDLLPIVHDPFRVVRFRGLAKLREWTPDAVLRCSFQVGPLRVYFRSGQESVVLFYYENVRQWAAYRTTLPPGQLAQAPARQLGPAPIALLTTDDRRTMRLADDTFEVRWQDGAVVLTKGDVRILTAPLAGPPTAVYLESPHEIMLRDLALCRSGPVPEEPVRPHRLVLGNDPPATLPWKEELPTGARFERLPDGRVELSFSGEAKTCAWVTIPVPPVGLGEAIVEVENASPGTGVFLADDEEHSLGGVQFAPDSGTLWTSFEYSRPEMRGSGIYQNPEHSPATFAAQRQWFRMIVAAGQFRFWTSGDGIHWGQVGTPQATTGSWRRIGLFAQCIERQRLPGDRQSRRIQLRTLQIRQLDGVTGLASPALAEQAAKLVAEVRSDHRDPDWWKWSSRVKETRPSGADAVAWRYACDVQVLAGCSNRDLVRVLLEELIADGVKLAGSLEARLRLLQDAAIVWDAGSHDDALQYAKHWDRLGRSLLVDGSSTDFDLVRKSFMAASLYTREKHLDPVSMELARDRIFVLLGQQQWRELHAWCNQLMFLHQGPNGRSQWQGEHEPLLRLLEWVGTELGGVRTGANGQKSVGAEAGWRQAASLPVNREAYNVVSDLQSAAEEGLYPDVAHLLASVAIPAAGGVIPDSADFQLFTSFSTAVKLLAFRHPQIQKAINDRFKAADQLRVRQTIAEGDAASIEALTVQYYGTPAAAAAHFWLGDRFLSSGALVLALSHYRQSLGSVSAEQRDTVAARVRLASAMMGQNVGEPAHGPVAFGDTQVSPGLLEQWVREAIQRHNGGHEAAKTAGPSLSPTGFEAQIRTKFEGDAGRDANQAPWPAKGMDWPARQMAVLPVGDLLLVTNRFQVAALDLGAGKWRWTYGLGGNQGPTHGWSLLPMRPVVAGNQVYARMLTQSGHPEIVCLDLATGNKRWQRECPGEMVSDPLAVHGRLFALAVEAPQSQLAAQLLWVQFNPETGDVVSRKTLFELQGEWAANQRCQAVVVGDSVVACLAGMRFCIDSEEQLSWLRSSPCIPPSFDASSMEQYSQPPLVAGRRLYVAQPGVPAVECIDLETGEVAWRRALVGLRRILDVADGRLLIQTADGIQAFRADTGQLLWQREIGRMLDGFLRPAPGLLLCARVSWLTDQPHPVFLWIDLETGKTKARSPVPGLAAKQPAIGPMVAMRNRVWCFSRANDSGDLQPQRSVVELVPKGAALPGDEGE